MPSRTDASTGCGHGGSCISRVVEGQADGGAHAWGSVGRRFGGSRARDGDAGTEGREGAGAKNCRDGAGVRSRVVRGSVHAHLMAKSRRRLGSGTLARIASAHDDGEPTPTLFLEVCTEAATCNSTVRRRALVPPPCDRNLAALGTCVSVARSRASKPAADAAPNACASVALSRASRPAADAAPNASTYTGLPFARPYTAAAAALGPCVHAAALDAKLLMPTTADCANNFRPCAAAEPMPTLCLELCRHPSTYSCCRSFVFVSLAWLRWCAYGAPARLADSTSWISCFATTRWSVVTLDPGKGQMNILLLVDTTIEGASPSHARQE